MPVLSGCTCTAGISRERRSALPSGRVTLSWSWRVTVTVSVSLTIRLGPGICAGPPALVLKPQTGSPPVGPPVTWMVPLSAQRSQAPAVQVVAGSEAEAAVAGARAWRAIRDGGTSGLTPGFGALAGSAGAEGAGVPLGGAGFVLLGVVGVGDCVAACTGAPVPMEPTRRRAAVARKVTRRSDLIRWLLRWFMPSTPVRRCSSGRISSGRQVAGRHGSRSACLRPKCRSWWPGRARGCARSGSTHRTGSTA